MTESEAIEGLGILNNGLNEAFVNADELSEALQMAIQALEEVQKYREIGSIEECRASREKQIAKKPIPIDYGKYIGVIDNARFLRGAYWCPNCKHVVNSGSFCKDCGQKLDWSDEDEID